MPAPIIAKVGKEVATHPKETIKLLTGIVAGFVVVLVFLSTIILSQVSSLVGEELDNDYVIEESTIYKNIEVSWNEYIKELKKSMDEEEERIKEEYAEKDEEVHITRQINNINFAYILAYLTHINDNYKIANSLEEVIYDEDKVLEFMDNLSVFYRKTIPVSVQANASDGIEYSDKEIEEMVTEVILYNRIISPISASEFLSADEIIQENYINSFYLYCEWLGNKNIYTDGLNSMDVAIDFMGNKKTTNNFLEVPTYYQQNYTQHYSTGTIASDGCGPTCVAMTFSYILGEVITPKTVVDWTGDSYAYEKGGSYWSLFPGCAKHWNVTCTDLGMNTDNVLSELEAGHVIIASMGSGTFTSSGHFIVLCGTTEGNMFKIKDPNIYNFEKYNTVLFDCNLVFNEAKNFWSFY